MSHFSPISKGHIRRSKRKAKPSNGTVAAIIANALSEVAWPVRMSLTQWWRALGRTRELSGPLSVGIVCATIYAGSVVAQHIQDVFAHEAAAITALYMDSVVEPLVQELVAKPS